MKFNQRDGVFSAEPLAVQRLLGEQDLAVAIATLRYDPLGVINKSLSAVAKQAMLTRLEIFNAALPGDQTAANLPPSYPHEVRASRYASGTFPVVWMCWATTLSSIMALGFLVLAVCRSRRSSKADRIVAAMGGLVLLGLVANAGVTGALSKPHDRYNTRVLWLLPLVALAQVIAVRDRKKTARHLAPGDNRRGLLR
jgi:hypothetical protein